MDPETILPSGSVARQRPRAVPPRVWRQMKAREGGRPHPSRTHHVGRHTVYSAGSPPNSCFGSTPGNKMDVFSGFAPERERALLTASHDDVKHNSNCRDAPRIIRCARERPYEAALLVPKVEFAVSPIRDQVRPQHREAPDGTFARIAESWTVFTSQIRMVPSLDPEATRSSGNAATHQTKSWCPSSVRRWLPSGAHTMSFSSRDPETMRPSGMIQTHRTRFVCSARIARQLPSAASRIFRVRSSDVGRAPPCYSPRTLRSCTFSHTPSQRSIVETRAAPDRFAHVAACAREAPSCGSAGNRRRGGSGGSSRSSSSELSTICAPWLRRAPRTPVGSPKSAPQKPVPLEHQLNRTNAEGVNVQLTPTTTPRLADSEAEERLLCCQNRSRAGPRGPRSAARAASARRSAAARLRGPCREVARLLCWPARRSGGPRLHGQ